MATPVSGKTARAGFTLVETLVALMVVAVAYAGVSTAVSQFLDQRVLVMERHAAHRVAWNRMMEQYLMARDRHLAERGFGDNEGETSFMGRSWRWRLTAENASGQDLVRYQVEVYNQQSGESSSGSLAAFLNR